VFRGAVRLSRPSLRMVSCQAKRRNGSIPRPPCGNRPDARMASGISRDAKLYVYSRRSTVPHFFEPPGDAAIAACSSACAWCPLFHAISEHLVSLTRRSWSKPIPPMRIQSEPNGVLPIRSLHRSVYNRSAQIIFPHTRRTIAGDGSWLTRWMYSRRNRFGESPPFAHRLSSGRRPVSVFGPAGGVSVKHPQHRGETASLGTRGGRHATGTDPASAPALLLCQTAHSYPGA
jgi:hypothetical protein